MLTLNSLNNKSNAMGMEEAIHGIITRNLMRRHMIALNPENPGKAKRSFTGKKLAALKAEIEIKV